ncbi:possible septum site-determining protein [Synechococcus sp. WH 7805]|uniref:septum site-determining protein MinC n=1 Tax=unclassified Synechococcus TaxID=2626047 RepID=UPI00006B3D96|nr:septum site-determining protein MinC [Synechococcus sp. WH 7805]EAR18984.1 possible septum site-determining protein [Synechococcus sp. WH 7805]
MKAASPSQAQRVLILPPHKSCHWNQWVPDQRESLPVGSVDLDMGDWSMGCRELTELMEALGREGYTVQQIITHCPKTQIGAAALGFPTGLRPMADTDEETGGAKTDERRGDLRIHRGTLRSGDHLSSEGHALVIGDVNPGASVTAQGNVYVWGRLRGRAHAGAAGNLSARIIALQLRPLQLRIADLVARGPEEPPMAGQAEQACIRDGDIAIEPARPPFTG